MTIFRALLSAVLSLAIVWAPVFSLPVRAAGPPPSSPSPEVLGTVTQSQAARIGQSNAVPGDSIFNGDTVTVGSAGAAWLSLRGGAGAQLGAETRVRLTRAGDGIELQVLNGEVTFRSTPSGRLVGRVADGLFEPVSGGIAVGQVAYLDANRRALFAARQGNWLLAAHNGSVALHPGEAARAQAAPSSDAGQVAVVVPNVDLARGKKKAVATPHAPVYWGDVVQSQRMGRARIDLNDGSILNVGSQSSLEIAKHDAAAQQTQVELLYGRTRARAVHLAKPGAKFEIHTRLGTAGVVGTDFYLALEGDNLRLIVFDGTVHFCNLAGACVDVGAGQTSTIHDSLAPVPPISTPNGLALDAENSTDVVPHGTEVGGGGGRSNLVLILLGAGAVGGATGIGLLLGGGENSIPFSQIQNAISPVVP